MIWKNQIVFTDWYTVNVCTAKTNDIKEIPVPKFLRELERNLKGMDYNITFDEESNEFDITYKGKNYEVVLNKDDQISLVTNEYSALVLKLRWLTSLDKKYTDEFELIKYREERLKQIIESNYEDMKTLEDYEILLGFLNQSLKKVKTEEEKNTINTKISAILPTIDELRKEEKEKKENPLSLRLHLNRFIYNALGKIDALNDEDRVALAGELKKILIDFKQIVDDYNKNKDDGLVIGDPMFPSSILQRIIDIEFKIKSVVKKDNIVAIVDDELGDIENELRAVVDNGGKHK